MKSDNTAFFSTANSGYVVYAATSLLTIRDQLPDAKLFIISSGLSNSEKAMLEKNDIELIEKDLSNIFTKVWEYPIDCYYIFAGPEIFFTKGYKYSLYIDGDIFCARNPLLNNLPKRFDLAGASRGEARIIFGDDWPKLQKHWKISANLDKLERINSGVVYFNNKKMIDFKLLDKAGKLFQVALRNKFPRKGDDSLLALLLLVYNTDLKMTYLEKEYNYAIHGKGSFNKIRPVFCHFVVHKPWEKYPYRFNDSERKFFKPYMKLWNKKLHQISI